MKKYLKEIILFAAALLITGSVLVVANTEVKNEYVYDIVVLGDSIIGNSGNAITGILEERLDKSVYNGALGGTCMSFNSESAWESLNTPQWSMAKLTEAICSGDWTSQLASVSYATKYDVQILDYFYERLHHLAGIDFSQVEILIIEHGTNDYNNGQLFDSDEDKFDINTFGGALRTSLRALQEKYSNLRIVLVSPIYCEIMGGEAFKSYEADFGGGVLDEYVALEKEIAAEYGVEWIDLYYGSGIWEDNIDTYLYDKLHPSEAGEDLIGNLLADYFVEVEG